MIYYKTREEIERLRESSLLVSKTLAEVAKHIKLGANSLMIDRIAEELIRDHGAEPAFKGYRGFPNSLCVSMNEQVVHGIPSKKEFVEGDIVSVDCGVKLNGYYGDSAYTFALAPISDEVEDLLVSTKQSLFFGIDKAISGNRIGDIGFAIQNYLENEKGYYVVRDLVGHGVGKELHEDPEVPNYGKRGSGIKLQEGLVVAIEPMVNLGTRKVTQMDDGWTIRTADKSTSAHYELMIAVRKGKADVLSTFYNIEEEVRNNDDLKSIIINKEIIAN